MKETPILFSTKMVKAILDNRKTQTRRVITRPEQWMIEFNGESHTVENKYGESVNLLTLCPYGQPGDLLYVRETWAELGWYEHCDNFVHHIGEHDVIFFEECGTKFEWRDDDGGADERKDGSMRSHWKPSIHMPKWAARIWLEITNVGIQRVQDITGSDAKAEGIGEPYACRSESGYNFEMRYQFRKFWNSINEKRGYGWDSNPFVWVIEFRRKMKLKRMVNNEIISVS
jgi:hypothetical protein